MDPENRQEKNLKTIETKNISKSDQNSLEHNIKEANKKKDRKSKKIQIVNENNKEKITKIKIKKAKTIKMKLKDIDTDTNNKIVGNNVGNAQSLNNSNYDTNIDNQIRKVKENGSRLVESNDELKLDSIITQNNNTFNPFKKEVTKIVYPIVPSPRMKTKVDNKEWNTHQFEYQDQDENNKNNQKLNQNNNQNNKIEHEVESKTTRLPVIKHSFNNLKLRSPKIKLRSNGVNL